MKNLSRVALVYETFNMLYAKFGKGIKMEKLHWLWPTLVYETEIEGVGDVNLFNQKILSGVITHQQEHSTDAPEDAGPGSPPADGIISTNHGIHNLWEMGMPELDILKREFLRASEAWFKHADLEEHIPNMQLGEAWMSISQHKQFLPPHAHGNMELVTIYYLTKPEGNVRQSCTIFHDPRTSIELREGNNTYFESLPKPGKLITFPGHIQHWTAPNQQQLPRVTIGGHTLIKDRRFRDNVNQVK